MSELNLGPEKTILTYDGVKYVKQIVQEILTEDDIPTGHFFRHIERSGDPSILVPTIPDDGSGGSSPSPGGSGGTPPSTDEEEDDTVLTILGTYLDNDDNYKKFKEDFYDFIKMKVGLINYNPYVHLIVGDSQVFSLQHSIAVNTVQPPHKYSNLFEAFMSIIQKLGYVNDAPEFVTYSGYKSIKITITSKTKPVVKKDFYFISMDSYAYKYTSAGSAK